jgi:hypothetical protein
LEVGHYIQPGIPASEFTKKIDKLANNFREFVGVRADIRFIVFVSSVAGFNILTSIFFEDTNFEVEFFGVVYLEINNGFYFVTPK